MAAHIIYATPSAPDDTSPAKMYWRCSCGGDGVDVPGAQSACPGCGETVRVPNEPVDVITAAPELTAGVAPPQTVSPLLDPRYDLRELAYRILVSPDLYLFGHKGGGVGLHCRTCPGGGNTPLAFHGAEEGGHRNPEIAYASSVSGLWAQAAIHLAIHHSPETP